MKVIDMFTIEEFKIVLNDLHRKSATSLSARINLMVFRLSCCCGLRASEICALNVGDVLVGGKKPCIRLRRTIVKGKRRPRVTPLWWDAGTLEDFREWMQEPRRLDAPFISQANGKRYNRFLLSQRWKRFTQILGDDRARQLHIHSGRHTFCSFSLVYGKRSLMSVRDAAGHASVSVTSVYLHSIDEEGLPDTFA